MTSEPPEENPNRTRRNTTRRLFCAAVGTGVLAGCLEFEEGADGSTAPADNSTEAPDGTPPTPAEQTTGEEHSEDGAEAEVDGDLELTEAWSGDGLTHTFVSEGQVVGRDSPDVRIYAFDGELLWETQSSGPSSYTIWPSAGQGFARNDETVFIHHVSFGNGEAYDARIYAFDADDGTELWYHGTGDDRIVAMTATEDTLFYATRPFDRSRRTPIRALDLETRDHRWERTPSERRSRPRHLTVHDGRLYVPQEQLRVLDVDDGATHREIEIPGGTSSATDEDGTLYLKGGSNAAAVSLEDGHTEWHIEFDRGSGGSTQIEDGVLYSGDDSGYVTAHDIDADEQRWQTRVDGAVWSPPSVASGVLWVYGNEGNVYGLDASDGERLYRRRVSDDDGNVTAFGDRVYIPGPHYRAYDIERQ